MLRVNVCGSPFAKLAVLGNLAVVLFGFGVVAADEVPVVLYETNHLGFGEDPYNVGLFGSYGIDVAIDGDALMVADNILSEDFGNITSYEKATGGSWGNRTSFTSGDSVDIEGQRALVGNYYACGDDGDDYDCATGTGYGSVNYF